MNMAKTAMIIRLKATVYGELRNTYPPQPIRRLSETTIQKVSPKNARVVIQKIAEVIWYRSSKRATWLSLTASQARRPLISVEK
ncbi:MAG TPA: hypothetical protein VGE22_17045 [Solimonas sp.]